MEGYSAYHTKRMICGQPVNYLSVSENWQILTMIRRGVMGLLSRLFGKKMSKDELFNEVGTMIFNEVHGKFNLKITQGIAGNFDGNSEQEAYMEVTNMVLKGDLDKNDLTSICEAYMGIRENIIASRGGMSRWVPKYSLGQKSMNKSADILSEKESSTKEDPDILKQQQKYKEQTGPIIIHFETFKCSWEGNLFGQMHCDGSVDVSINNDRRMVKCFNNSLQKSSSDLNLMMTLQLFDSSQFDDAPTAQVSLFRDGNIKAERKEDSGETISVPLENLAFYLEPKKNMGSRSNNGKPLHPDTIAYNNSLDRYMSNSDVKEFELMMKCKIGDASERSYVTVGQANSMREVFDKALLYGERLITGQIDPDPQKAHILNHVGAMFLASKNDDILITKLAKAFNMKLFDQDFMELLCRIISFEKYTPNNDDATKKERELYYEVFHPVWDRASYLKNEETNAIWKDMGLPD